MHSRLIDATKAASVGRDENEYILFYVASKLFQRFVPIYSTLGFICDCCIADRSIRVSYSVKIDTHAVFVLKFVIAKSKK